MADFLRAIRFYQEPPKMRTRIIAATLLAISNQLRRRRERLLAIG